MSSITEMKIIECEESPDFELVGTVANWILPLDDFVDGKTTNFQGQFIGYGSSHRHSHINHDTKENEFAEKGVTCSACRWFEVRIFRDNNQNKFLLYTTGESAIPKEQPRYRSEWITSPYEIIESLTTVRSHINNDGHRTQQTILSYAARKALSQAIYYNTELQEAYLARVVAL